MKGKPVPPGGGVPLYVQSREGFTLLVGKNSRQNEDVTFHQATANDMWLHASWCGWCARDYQSCWP